MCISCSYIEGGEVGMDSFGQQSDMMYLYETYADMVYRIGYCYFGNRHDTQDVVQGVFLKLLDGNLPTFQDAEHEKAFLIVMTKNYCKDILKSSWRRKRVQEQEIQILQQESGLRTDMAYALMRLPEKYKLTLYLYYYEGYSVKEIAKLLEQKETTIQTHLLRGRKKLKIELEQEGYYDRKRSQGTI